MKPTIAVLAVLLAVGCGAAPKDKEVASVSGDGKTTSESPKPADDKVTADDLLAFTKCMREQGIEMPDPKTEKGGVGMRVEGDADMEKMQKADEACKHLLPNGGEMRKPSPQDIDKMREQAKCMRDKGYDMPDPDAEKPGAMALPFDDSEKTQKDMKECGFEGMVRIGG